jgi:hypothetical protein
MLKAGDDADRCELLFATLRRALMPLAVNGAALT